MPKREKTVEPHGYVKWISMSAVPICAMVLFREPIGRLIDRSDELAISPKGMTIKAAKTPIGDMVVSSHAAPAAATAASADLQTYAGAGYSLQFPNDGTWRVAPELAATLQNLVAGSNTTIDVVLAYHESFGDFTPNVNVLLDRIGPESLRDYLARNQAVLGAIGYSLETQEIDDATHSAVQVVRHPSLMGGLYQIQRIVLRDGTAFVATVSRRLDEPVAGLDNAFREILSSFEVGTAPRS